MEWQGRHDARENMGYAWNEEDYEDYQGSYQDQDYFHQAQAYQQEPSYQGYEFQAWDSTYHHDDANSNQPPQDLDIKAMLQTIMESQEMGRRKMNEELRVEELSQDFDVKAMMQQFMECQEMGEREIEKNFKEMHSQLDQATSSIKVLESQLAQVESSSKVQDESKTSEILEGEKSELRVMDSWEFALLVERIEYGLLRGDPNGFKGTTYESEEMVVEDCLEQEVTELPSNEESDHEGSAHEESWSELKAPELEINQLPKGLRYAFLEPNSTYPVIINDVCDEEVKWLLVELSENRKATCFSLNNIQSISHSLCLHYTHLEEESRTFIELQSGLNPHLLNVFTWEDFFHLPFIDQIKRLGNHAVYCSPLGVFLSNLCRLLWWLTLLLLALLVITKLKLFPGDKG